MKPGETLPNTQSRNGREEGVVVVIQGLLVEARALFSPQDGAGKALIDHAIQLLSVDRQPVPGDIQLHSGQALSPSQTARLRAFIDDHLEETIRIDDLVALTRTSPSYFYRAFRGTFGMSPHAFILKRRVVRAQQLLLTTSLPLCQIAVTCGLADQAHFCRIFRRETGSTPGNWRRTRLAGIAFVSETPDAAAEPLNAPSF